ncbi:MAG: hypothetical protein KOO63_10690 [Bacteroidales bacterium]|nr:hypothetical protein [Candidatus Latescibacterota bacterium]
MKTHTDYLDAVTLVIRRALEGRISPLNFLLIVGFFSSLVLLYISLHVHFQTLSGELNDEVRLKQKLTEERIFLTAEHDRLSSPERIIPLVKELGLRAGSSEEVKRVAFYNSRKLFKKESAGWAQIQLNEGVKLLPPDGPEN